MTIRDIVREYLVAHGYDGLANSEDWDGCGCGVDDLMPCDEPYPICQPARKMTWGTCEFIDDEGTCPHGYKDGTCGGCYTIEERGQC